MEIGAFLSLAVTVAGGVVVYYFSQWNEKQAGERLVYKVEKASVFEDNTQSLSIQQVYLANEGGDQSQNVKLVVGFGEDTRIDDYRVDFLSMIPSDHSINPQSENKIEVAVESLTAGETVRVSLLLSGEPPEQAIISAKSLGMIAQEIDYVPGSVKPETLIVRYLPLLIVMAAGGQLALLAIFRRCMNKLSAKHYETFPNNTAFLLLHQGLHEEGEQMLVETTRRAGADRYILGNLALCKALRAEFGEANLLFKAAEFVGGNEHSMAVLNLNIALCFYMQGDLRAGDEFLARALRGSREEICRYLEYSKVVEELRSRSNELDRHVSRILNSVEEEKKPASGAPARDYPV